MIDGHPRLGFAVAGGVLATLIALGILILRTGGDTSYQVRLTYQPATTIADVGASVAPSTNAPSRSLDRATKRPPGVDLGWAQRTAAAAGIPEPALVAYGDAQLTIERTQPGCHLSWNTLAGIGWIESQNGTIGNRTLNADGLSSSPIIGPALNGQGFAAIHSTPQSAAWHGDTTWEHAVGPMQFIASTWERWGADGDGDGVANPLDIDDAALTTAKYLCADGHDLSTVAGWNAAVHSYNHDQQYVLNVLAAANTYAQRTGNGR